VIFFVLHQSVNCYVVLERF